MTNLNFCLFLLSVGIFAASGQKDYSAESETASDAPNKNASDSKSTEEKGKKHNRQGFLITPDEGFLIDERLFQAHKPGFYEDGDVPSVKIPIGGRRQNVHLTDGGGRYNVQLENFQHENPTQFQAALGAISAHIINQRNQEYVPYPPNGDPRDYPAYRGHPHGTEPPVIRAYERSSGAHYDAPPPRRMLANNIYERTFPELGSLGPGFYAGNFFNNGAPEQVRDSGRVNNWYEDQRRAGRVFYGP